MSEKLIVPAEVKVCATCTYWDGDRQVDDDLQVVVVDCACEGECLVQQKILPALHDTRQETVCDWEDLGTDPPEISSDPAKGRD